MEIAYLNKGKAAKLTETEKLLRSFEDREIRLCYRKYKDKLDALGISEIQFIRDMKEK